MSDFRLSATNLTVPAVYKPIFEDEYRYFILASGRISGKTCALVCIWWYHHNKYPDRDIVFLQATKTEIKDSVINEIKKFVTNSGLDEEYDIPESATKITRKGYKGITYFYPITDSKGGQRSRGISTENPISLVLYEETQKNKDANVVEQSVITFVRQIDKMAKIVIVGNNETIGHWFLDYVDTKRKSSDWCYIYACYKDIWNLLNSETQKYIVDAQAANEIEFRRVFLGDVNAGSSDVVFPQFSRVKHYKRRHELQQAYITKVIIGIDHATANDAFAVVPVGILDNGETQTLEVLHDDPEETQKALAPTEQCAMFEDYLEFLDDKYGFAYNHLDVILSVDSAAAPFIAQLKHLKRTARRKDLWKRVDIRSFGRKNKTENLSMIKNAFAYGVLTILNEGGKTWNGLINQHKLAREIERQRYIGGGSAKRKLDPKIANDLCDALEYGLIPYYTNCYNLSFPIRKANYRESARVNDIVKFANVKAS